MSYGDPRYGNRGNGNGIGLAVRMIPILIGLATIGFTMAKGCQQGPFGRVQVVVPIPPKRQSLVCRRFMKHSAPQKSFGKDRQSMRFAPWPSGSFEPHKTQNLRN